MPKRKRGEEGKKDLRVPSKLLRKVNERQREIDKNKKSPMSKIGVAAPEVEKPGTSESVSQHATPPPPTLPTKAFIIMVVLVLQVR